MGRVKSMCDKEKREQNIVKFGGEYVDRLLVVVVVLKEKFR